MRQRNRAEAPVMIGFGLYGLFLVANGVDRGSILQMVVGAVLIAVNAWVYISVRSSRRAD